MRKIVFAGLDTLANGIRINSERSTVTELSAKIAEENIPCRDGTITTLTGRNAVNLTYCLVLHDTGRDAIAAKSRYIAQLFSSIKGDLLDSDIPGKKYTNAVFVNAEPLEYVSRNFTTAYMTVHFRADPIPQELGAVNERVLKLSAAGNATINIAATGTGSYSYTVTTSAGTSTAATFTAAAPYKFRVVCYAENPEAITFNGTTIAADQIFTMSGSSTIVIAAVGYKYVELWHDTRMGVRL